MTTRLQPASGEQDAEARFDGLFRSLYAELHRLAFRVVHDRDEADEVVQDAFLRLSTAPVLTRPDDEVGAWMRRVCLNLGFNRLRDNRRGQERIERAARLDPIVGVHVADPGDSVVLEENRRGVQIVLATLPERQRTCLMLRHSGYSYAEIAASLDMPIGSVGVVLARGERAFRSRYEEVRR